MSFKDVIFSFDEDNFFKILSRSHQGEYLFKYLNTIGAKTIILEHNYVSKDYLIDYQKFYSRSFRAPERFTKRVHFFSKMLTSKDLISAIDNVKDNTLQDNYLGFTIVKPIKDEEGNFLLGRTILKTYPEKEGTHNRHYITTECKASLFGIEFEVESIPFQSQDKGVSACATIALWIAFRALHPLFQLKERAPAEITEVSTKLPTEARIFPQGGLSLQQMITCIRLSDLDVEIISELDDETIETAVKAFIDAGIPIIVDLELSLKDDYRTAKLDLEHHAAVIVGYRLDEEGKLDEFYVHDDQIGPYSRAKPLENLSLWKNEWLSAESKYNKVRLEKLVVPIYHKIRLSWIEMYDFHKKYKKDAKEMRCEVDLLLTTVQKYKKHLRTKKIDEKEEILQRSLPRFLCIERFYSRETNGKKLLFDHVFDGTAIYPNIELVVTYQ